MIQCGKPLAMCGLIVAVLAGNGAQGAPASAAQSKADCLCYRVCEFRARRVFKRSDHEVVPELATHCPRLNDEVIYDNMAKCACAATPATEKTNTSPNH